MGHPLTPTQYEAAVVEGRRRIEARIPPGYKDAAKRGDRPLGDYLLWHQILQQAAIRKCSVLFVTGDVKEDWWRLEQGLPVGPRVELLREMLDVTGCPLLMLRPNELLGWASELLSVKVPASALEYVGRVQRLQQAQLEEQEEKDEQGNGTAWTAATVSVVMNRLYQESPALANTIRRAVEYGGFVGRDEVYEIAGFEEGRSLRGFTRPVRRIVAYFQSQDLVPLEAENLIDTVYDDQTGSATGFEVPAAVVPLFKRKSGPGRFDGGQPPAAGGRGHAGR